MGIGKKISTKPDYRRGPDITPAATGYRADLIYGGSETSYMKAVLNEAPGY